MIERDYEFECGHLCVALLIETLPSKICPDDVLMQAIEHGLMAAQDYLPASKKLKEPTELSILVCDEAQIQELNKEWRGKDYATNVLSFPAAKTPFDMMPNLGDIAMCLQVLEKEASEMKIAPMHHITHLAVHSFLHLFGYDHENEADAKVMESLEIEILASMGIENPYA